MRIAIYNRYFATMGGGERRTAALAIHLRAKHDVVLFVAEDLDPARIRDGFGMDLAGVEVVALGSSDHFESIAARSPDLFINNSYRSALPCPAPRGIYMCMFPEGDPINLSSYNVITANSQYTASWVHRRWGYEAEVVYSACQPMGPPGQKEKTILSVGRFFAKDDANHHKRQDALLQAFTEMARSGLDDWRLQLVGNVGSRALDREYVDALQIAARGHPIEICVGARFDDLRELYRRASIYWHGTGFGSSLTDQPEKHEHFGMSIVEAMSAGAVPLAFDSGGPREIIRQGTNGYLWKDLDDLKMRTCRLAADQPRLQAMSIAAEADGEQFDVRRYLARMDSIIARLTGEQPSR